MTKKLKTPVLDKLLKVAPESRKIGDFLEWLSEQEIILAEWTGSECTMCGETLMDMTMSNEALLAKYFGIDLAKAEKERQAILDDLRIRNAQAE